MDSSHGDLEAELDRARTFYNTVRSHKGLGYVTPDDEHTGRGEAIRAARRTGRLDTPDALDVRPYLHMDVRSYAETPSRGRHRGHRAVVGHADIRSTNVCLHADMTIKQRALELTTPTSTPPGRYRPSDSVLSFLAGL